MSDIVGYARSVKKVKSGDIQTRLSVAEVSAKELADNIDRLDNAGLNLNAESSSWAITKSINSTISRSYPYSTETPTITLLGTIADVIIHTIEPIKTMVKQYKQEIWDGEVMSTRQVYILSAIEQIEFWLNYSNKLLDCLLSMNNQTGFVLDKYLTKNELIFVNGSVNAYANISVAFLKGAKALISEILRVPDVEAMDEVAAEVLGAFEKQNLELNRGFGIHLVNPKYWYYEAMKEIDLIRIRSANENNEYLAMKIAQAINKKTGNDDARLDHRIETYREKIVKNSATINKIVDYWNNL